MTRYSPTRAVLALAAAALLAGLSRADDAAIEAPPLVREVFVPYEELLRIAAADPSGLVLSLEEYRELLARALANRPAPAPLLAPPPIDAIARRAEWDGRFAGGTVSLRGRIAIAVARDGWVRCDLGPAPAHLGALRVDGAPGWALIAPAGEGKDAPRRLHLILRGRGEHEAEIELSLPAREVEDRWLLEGILPQAAASLVRLAVPGPATGESDPPELRVARQPAAGGEDERTVFEIGLGARGALRLTWKPDRGAGRLAPSFSARHELVYDLDPRSPAFLWRAAVEVHRRKAEAIDLVPPPGARVLSVRGPLVHSFAMAEAPEGPVLRVLLHQPTHGGVALEIAGLLAAPAPLPPLADGRAPARFALGTGALRGAVRDRGLVGLRWPASSRVLRFESPGFEAADPAAEAPEGSLLSGAQRLVAFHAAGARLDLDLASEVDGFEVRATQRLRIARDGAQLHAVYRLRARSGSGRGFELLVPAPFEALSIQESGSDRGLRGVDLLGQPDVGGLARRLRVDFERAVGGDAEAVVAAVFEWKGFGAAGQDLAAGVRAALALPSLLGVARQRLALAIELDPALDAALDPAPSWRAMTMSAIAPLGIEERWLVAALETDLEGGASPSPLALTLEKKGPRGVYEAVVHALALDRALRVRIDARIAVPGRAVEEVEVLLPAPAETVSVLPPGTGKLLPAGPGRARLRFDAPWQGEKAFRLEYEAALAPGAPAPLPLVAFEPAPVAGAAPAAPARRGALDPLRFVTIASVGGVRVQPQPGAALVPVEVDELPEFSAVFSEGRTVAAYRVEERALAALPAAAGGAPAPGAPSFIATVHARSPVAESAIAELALVTTLDASGVSRSSAAFIIAHGKEQHLDVELESGARVLSLEVDGEPQLPVRGGAGALRIPLPPRTHASVHFVYERRGPALGRIGEWTERGPSFPGLAREGVIRSRWTLHLPPGYRLELAGESIDSLGGRRALTFASSFWGRLVSLKLPRWTSWEAPLGAPIASLAAAPAPQTAAAAPASQTAENAAPPAQGVQSLVAEQVASQQARAALPVFRLVAEGQRYEAEKLGGQPSIAVRYRQPRFEVFAKRLVFLAAAAFGIALIQRRGRAVFAAFAAAALAIATFLPAAFDWDSPLLMLPLAEGIAATALGAALLPLARLAGRALSWPLRAWRARRRLKEALAAAAIAAAASLVATASAQTPAPAVPPKAAAEAPVVVPYALGTFGLPGAPEKRKVYIPYVKFVELWNLAYPDRSLPVEGVEARPADFAVGNAGYRLKADGAAYRIDGDIELRVFSRDWIALALRFGGAQLSDVRLDGAPAGVSYRDGVPFLAILGEGTHRLQVVLEGKVERGLAEASVALELLAGAATRVDAELPPAVELERIAGPGGAPVEALTADATATRARVDLGGDGRLLLRWRSQAIESERAPVVTARSLSSFALEREGYRVLRLEEVRIEGPDVSHLRFRVLGAWDITEARGRDLSEWALHPSEDGTGQELEVFFTRRSTSFDLAFLGFARLGEEAAQAAGLDLTGATRQEGFVALRHHPLRRFHADVLAGLTRASVEDFGRSFQAPEGVDVGVLQAAPDRLFRFHGSLAGQSVRQVAAPLRGRLETQLVGIIASGRISTAGRAIYGAIEGPGPLEYQVPMPDGWTPVSARGDGVADWDLRAVDGERRLVIRFKGRARAGQTIEWFAEGPRLAAPPAPMALPSFRARSDLDQVLRWALAAGEDLEISEAPGTTFQTQPLESAARWLALEANTSYRMAYASSLPGAALAITAAPRRSLVRAAQVSLVQVSGTQADVKTLFRYSIERRGIDALRIRLPAGATLPQAELPTPARRRIDAAPEGEILTLTLPSPAFGELTLELSYRLARPAGESIAIEGPEPLDVDSARGYVAILAQPLLVFTPAARSGLEAISRDDLDRHPDLKRALGEFQAERLFEAVQRRWRIDLREETARSLPGFEALVEIAEIESVLAADGSNWNTAVYTVHNRSLQFLEVAMPAEARLWRVLVNGRSVRVSQGDAPASILIPIERLTETDLSLEVAITYTLPPLDLPAGSETFAPRAPALRLGSAQSFETLWRVYLPEGYVVSDVEGNLREVIGKVRLKEKVRNILGQIDRIERHIEQAGKEALLNQRSYSRAAGNLVELQKALSDAVHELAEPEREQQVQGQRFGTEDLRQQISENERYLEEGARKIEDLKRRSAAGEAKKGAAPRVDQAFDDARRFLEADPALDAGLQPLPPQGGANVPNAPALESFRDALGPAPAPALPAPGWSGGEGASGAKPSASTLAEALAAASHPLPRFEAEGVDVEIPPSGRLATFLGKVGDPVLAVDIRAEGRGARLAYGLALALTIAALGLWGWIARR
jgi:hypothetical protein